VLVLEPDEFEQHVRHTRIYFYTYNWPYRPPGGVVCDLAVTGTDAISTHETVSTSTEATSSPVTTIVDPTLPAISPPQKNVQTAGHSPSPQLRTPTQTQALPLGLGSLFNHSTVHQNVGWSRDVVRQLITYTTLRAVDEGQELCISYGESGRLGFEDADADAIRIEEEATVKDEERALLALGDNIDGEGEGENYGK